MKSVGVYDGHEVSFANLLREERYKILSFVNVDKPQIFIDPAWIAQVFDCLGIGNLHKARCALFFSGIKYVQLVNREVRN
jgi:hypothetical protein